jgi:hypothetical protein
MKISEILIEETPQGTVSHNRPKVVSPLNKQARDAGQQLLNKADTAAQDRVGPGDQDMAVGAEEKFNKAMGTTITTGKIDPNLEQSGKEYAKDLQGKLKNAQRPAPKVNQVQNRANK